MDMMQAAQFGALGLTMIDPGDFIPTGAPPPVAYTPIAPLFRSGGGVVIDPGDAPPVPTRATGASTTQQILSLINTGLDTFRPVIQGTRGQQLQAPTVQPTYEEGDRDRDGGAGEGIGAAVGRMGDSLAKAVEDHPLAFLGAGAALALYMIQPKRGGYSRGR